VPRLGLKEKSQGVIYMKRKKLACGIWPLVEDGIPAMSRCTSANPARLSSIQRI
jgi:hypothetical protein